MKLRKITVATVALAAALTMTACSSDDGGSTETTAANSTVETTTSEAAASDYPPVPTVEELQTMLDQAFDGSIPAEEKQNLVQGAELDPTLIDQVAAAAQQAGAKVTIIDINDNEDGTATAGIETAIGDQVSTGTVMFVAEDGYWKLSQDNACAIVSLAALQTPACP
ncbi:hypothetical protein HCA61_02900 [Rhodococcus sp. HNM0563]|uniref:hypothetical protein n=1 Tax=unclassified Rhodococcus (in: high G+C Gram-positive bacteria) TaxID=192944 RepID=UPI001469D718|nr:MULTISPECIES: hypothetical protein [unclassified Rhodococcus (in: high G+C Gram-positive bacteria)]MCK0092886.1 hypothetical protein [Rhodococcus sp. F64268]NLU61210.1 hypothetical protein [Rhodococcus sp. HNM0563]